MDEEETPWRTPTRKSGVERPRGADASDANGDAATAESGSATTTPPAASSGSSSNQKRKRHAKKRRRSSVSARDEAMQESDKAGRDDATDGKVSKRGDKNASSTSAAAAAPSEWSCPACTYLNDAARRFCEMCGTGNPTKPTVEKAPSEWSCVACTMKNAPALRACAVCGTINPNPSVPAALSIARRTLHGGLFLGGGGGVYGDEGDDDDDDDDEDDDVDDDSDGSSGSDSGSSSGSGRDGGTDADRRLECPCLECGVTIGAGQSSCPECHAPHPLPRRKLKRSDLSSRLHKLTRKISNHDKSVAKKKKSKDSQPKKNAYGVSSEVLRKLLIEPKSSKLVDTLQALTHTLAMMDASADSEWGDMHGGGGVNAFFVHGFGGSVARSDEGKDTALLDVLASILREEDGHFPAEVRLFAVQSINYILKMDRHLFKKEDVVEVVRIYLHGLKTWTTAAQSVKQTHKDEQMAVEECVNGLCGLGGSESAMLRELIKQAAFGDFLDFLTHLATHTGNTLHSSVVTNALELLQKCCAKIKWDHKGMASSVATADAKDEQLQLAKRIVDLLRSLLKHAQPALHVSASKCLLLLFRRGPCVDQRQQSFFATLITSEVILDLVAVLTSKNIDEPSDSRQAAASLLMHLLESRREMMEIFVHDRIYEPLLDGIERLMVQPNSNAALASHSLKLVSLLLRRVYRKPTRKHSSEKPRSTTPVGTCNRIRLDSCSDPDVLATLLLDFIRADSIPAVSALLKDGADLNGPSVYDSKVYESEKPLVVAAEVASLAMVRFLVKRGVDIHQVGPSGTALHVAALAGRCDVVSFLLECGASPTDVDREGVSVSKRLGDFESSEEEAGAKAKSPVRKLLELHQRALGQGGEDSDNSEDRATDRRFDSRRWLFSGGREGDEEDEEDEFDEDDYMEYDDSEDDSDEDEDMSSDEETAREEADAHGKTDQKEPTAEHTKKEKKRRRESVSSEKNEGKKAAKRSRRNSESAETPAKLATIERRRRASSEVADGDVVVLASPSQIECFRSTVMSSLLKMLRVVDHKNVNRGVLSTLASALEMAPSTLVQTISETDISLLLETVIHLLQDPIMSTRATHTHKAEAQMSSTLPRVEVDAKTSSSSVQASQKAMLTSYILSLRILQAIVRKSKRESSVFYEIERRGICEQIERLHAHSVQASQPPQLEGDCDQKCVNDRAGIFWRGMQLLEFLRSNMVESGMLHLHRLRNMTRRLKELSEDSPIQERDMVLIDLVELFEEENSITSHEFKQSNLLEAIQSFLLPTGHDTPIPKRVELLLDRFAGSPAAFTSLITRLQSVVNQEENLPLLSFFTGKGRELYPLTKQLKIVCTRAQHDSKDEPKFQKMLQLSALTHFQSFEKTIFRCMPVKDATLAAFYFSLIGHYVHKAVDGKWKKFWVCGFDQSRCMHLLKPVDDPASDEAAEIVLHDTQFKLSIAMDVYAEPTVDFSLFGDPHPDSSSDSTSNGDDKKRKRQSKKRRKSSVSESSGAGTAVEVQNVPSTNAGKLRGAWYAGEIVLDGSNGTAEGSDGVVTSIEAGKAYSVRLLSSGATLKNVQGDKIRLRHDVAQVGSVVEVDGLLGEVTRAESSQGNGEDDIFDVKISRDRERKGITKARIRYPPSANTPSPASSSGIIEAMSLSRLFPPRESSVVTGTIGDKVWVSPKKGADGASVPVGDFYLAGTIHSYPAGSDSIGPSASVFVEVSFGPKSSTIKVEQSRVTNLSNGRSSRLGSSRLLSALSMSGDRSGGTSASGPTLHRLLQSTASNELFSNRRITGSSESAIDHLRQLLAQSSSSRDSALSHLLNASSTDTISAIGSASTDEVEPKPTKRKDDDAQTHLARVWKLLMRGEKKLFSKCIRPPKMSVVIGYERTEYLDTAGNDRGYEDEFGQSSSLFAMRRSSDTLIGEASLTEIDSQTGKAVFKPAVASALSEVFVNFDGSEADSRSLSKSAKKARKKQKMAMHDPQSAACTDPNHVWDIDTFSAFMAAALGVSALDDPEGTLVDNCIKFSLFAAPATGRRRLDLSGFLACVVDACKSTRNARHLLRFLVSRGHDASSLTGEDPKRPTKMPAASPSTSVPARGTEVDMKSFPSDQNMLKCLNELQRGNASTDSTPPWKLKYFVQCDVVIDWSKVVKRDPDTSAHSMQEESFRVPHQLATIDSVLPDSLMAKAVHLLSCLHDSLPRSLRISDDVWRNPRLSSKLESQLEDVISVCSGIYPEWCDAVVSECKFFFPRELREKFFHATSFGCTRSLHWFRSQLNVDDAGGSASGNAATDSLANGPGIAGDGIYNHEITISPIPKERVKVNRENLLQSADAIMKMHAKRKAILDIVFVGEKGYGSGVTAAFYSATAQALQSTEENAKENSRCWVPGIENDREDSTIRHPNGLFPFPHAGTSAPTKVVERFRMIGRLAGKALMDNRLFPLPLSPQFIKLVLGQSVTTDELERVFLSPGKVVKDMKRAVDQVEAAVDTACIQVDGMPLVQWLDAVGFTFIDPLSQKELEPKGATKDVTLENLGEYVKKVISLWLHDGIHAQVQAFREGISDVLPVEKLNLLFVHELLSLLCGDADIAWDVASLTSTMKLAHGYTKDSVPVQYFVDVLAEMTVPQRREFLLYATGCPNLPGGGFAALRPPFEVVRRVVDTDNVDQALPFARTCTNTLHLPAYSSKKVLEERLRYAIANSAGVIDRD